MIAFDETFWVAISIILFLVLIHRYAKAPILSILDNYADTISKKLSEATSLEEESRKLLSEEIENHKKYMLEASEHLTHINGEIEALENMLNKDFEEKKSFRKEITAKIIKERKQYFISTLQIKAVEAALNVVKQAIFAKEMDKIRSEILLESLNSLSLKDKLN